MSDFVQLWVYLSATPLFGLTTTLVIYIFAQIVYVHLNQAPWANPVLWSVVCIATMLMATGVNYPQYFAGAQFIHFLLGPAVVALGMPLWLRKEALKNNWGILLLATTIGGAAASISAILMAWGLDLPVEIILSLAPKSVTAPVAMGISEKIGGIPALSAVFAVITGIVGAISGRYLFDLLNIPMDKLGWMARGFALGTASHGIGAARALQVNPDAGAYAGLALGLQVVIATLLMPILFALLLLRLF